MAEDGTADGPPPEGGPAGDWLARLAAERDLTREELVARIVDAAALDERVAALEDDVDAKIEDVRERVIQVKRETDAKAPAEHDHPAFEERLAGMESDLEAARERLEAIAEGQAALEERLDGGFENYEDLLEHLVDEAAEADRKLATLAGAVLDLRERADALAETAARRDAAAALAAAANREGVRRARCEECGDAVDVGLLHEPSCPHCDAGFSGVTAARGLFGTDTLETGTPPALEPGDDGDGGDLDDLLEASPEPPTDALDEEGGSGGDDDRPSTDGGRSADGWEWVGSG